MARAERLSRSKAGRRRSLLLALSPANGLRCRLLVDPKLPGDRRNGEAGLTQAAGVGCNALIRGSWLRRAEALRTAARRWFYILPAGSTKR
jgi:hypothetical protein